MEEEGTHDMMHMDREKRHGLDEKGGLWKHFGPFVEREIRQHRQEIVRQIAV